MESIKQMMLSGETQFLMSATTLIALIVITFKVSAYINTLKSKVDSNEERLVKVENKSDDIINEHNLQKLSVVVLETKLESIELGITEIKTMLVKHIESN